MFRLTQEWAEGMIVEALIARGVPEDEAKTMADMTGFLDRVISDHEGERRS